MREAEEAARRARIEAERAARPASSGEPLDIRPPAQP
jgi:hypothetical protein